MNDQHLIEGERYQIQSLHKEGITNAGIGRRLGRCPSTIGRELKRNALAQGYQAVAQQQAVQRRRLASVVPSIEATTWAVIESELGLEHSPQEITGRLRQQGKRSVSHERIYQHIAADRKAGGDLWPYRRGGKPRRHRMVPRTTRFRDGRPLSERPAEAADRATLGHWKGDTMVGTSLARLVSLVERKPRFTVVRRTDDGCAQTVLAAILQGLYPWQTAVPGCVASIAWDNGLEFAEHKTLDIALNCTSYFARPYASWERGTNENTNGFIRQYAPKKTDLRKLSDANVQHIADRLNDRPRRMLAFRTPREVFEESLSAMQKRQREITEHQAKAA